MKLGGILNHTIIYLLSKLTIPWSKKEFVSCEIRTHAHRSGLRPERSALDHSAKLTFMLCNSRVYLLYCCLPVSLQVKYILFYLDDISLLTIFLWFNLKGVGTQKVNEKKSKGISENT